MARRSTTGWQTSGEILRSRWVKVNTLSGSGEGSIKEDDSIIWVSSTKGGRTALRRQTRNRPAYIKDKKDFTMQSSPQCRVAYASASLCPFPGAQAFVYCNIPSEGRRRACTSNMGDVSSGMPPAEHESMSHESHMGAWRQSNVRYRALHTVSGAKGKIAAKCSSLGVLKSGSPASAKAPWLSRRAVHMYSRRASVH